LYNGTPWESNRLTVLSQGHKASSTLATIAPKTATIVGNGDPTIVTIPALTKCRCFGRL